MFVEQRNRHGPEGPIPHVDLSHHCPLIGPIVELGNNIRTAVPTELGNSLARNLISRT